MYKTSFPEKVFDAFFPIVVIVLIFCVIVMVATLLGSAIDDPVCAFNSSSLECRTHKVEACMKTELYTKDQCVILVGSGK